MYISVEMNCICQFFHLKLKDTSKPHVSPQQEDIPRHANRGLCTVEILKASLVSRIDAQFVKKSERGM